MRDIYITKRDVCIRGMSALENGEMSVLEGCCIRDVYITKREKCLY